MKFLSALKDLVYAVGVFIAAVLLRVVWGLGVVVGIVADSFADGYIYGREL